MTVSSLEAHAYLVNRGWASADLDAMDETEFLGVFATQVGMDEERAEAEARAMRTARSRR